MLHCRYVGPSSPFVNHGQSAIPLLSVKILQGKVTSRGNFTFTFRRKRFSVDLGVTRWTNYNMLVLPDNLMNLSDCFIELFYIIILRVNVFGLINKYKCVLFVNTVFDIKKYCNPINSFSVM